MKKLFSLFIISALVMAFTGSTQALQEADTSKINAEVYFFDPNDKDLLIRTTSFPVYFLVNLKNNTCPNFTEREAIFTHLISNSTLTKTSTGQTCKIPGNAIQIQGDFRIITHVLPNKKVVRTLDEDGNIHELELGNGCEAASHNQKVYLGTGWQEKTLILGGNKGSCSILNQQLNKTKYDKF